MPFDSRETKSHVATDATTNTTPTATTALNSNIHYRDNDSGTTIRMVLDPPPISTLIQTTIDPCVVLMQEMIGKFKDQWSNNNNNNNNNNDEHHDGIYNLSQGVVYWSPPYQCQEMLQEAIAHNPTKNNNNSSTTTNKMILSQPLHQYGPDEGLPELRQLLKDKVANENALHNVEIMITMGANQAYMNCVLTLLSPPNNKVIVFTPYYFNHYMALQMNTSIDNILTGPTNHEGKPDLDWLECTLQLYNHGNTSCNDNNNDDTSHNIRMVTIVNPGNPTGTTLARDFVQRAVDLCRQYGVWLILDTTYEDFVFTDSASSTSPSLPNKFDACFDESHCIHIFSFSKAYALAGYRCGYMTIPFSHQPSTLSLYSQFLKVQDTIAIAPSRISQIAAYGAMQAGRSWVHEQIQTLDTGRDAIRGAFQMASIHTVMGGTGAMYLMGKLPKDHNDDVVVVERLVRDFGVAVIPGRFCGMPGWIRVCYANLPPSECVIAASRLGHGLQTIIGVVAEE